MEPSFANYTLAELNQALSSIDAAAYPDRVERIKALITEREAEQAAAGFVMSGETQARGKQRSSIMVERMTAGTLLSVLMIGSVIGYFIFGLLLGVSAFFGVEAVKFNEQPLTGIVGFLAAPVMTVFAAAISALFSFIPIYIGLRLYAKFRPLEIEVVPLKTASDDQNREQ